MVLPPLAPAMTWYLARAARQRASCHVQLKKSGLEGWPACMWLLSKACQCGRKLTSTCVVEGMCNHVHGSYHMMVSSLRDGTQQEVGEARCATGASSAHSWTDFWAEDAKTS